MQGTIVCGVTATPEALAAAQLAGALAARLGLRLVLVHVVETPPADVRDDVPLEALAADGEIRIAHGSRVDALARVAADEGADMIVVGARAHGTRGRQLGWSLARQLEAAQSVPVLIAPPATRRRSSRRLRLAESAARR